VSAGEPGPTASHAKRLRILAVEDDAAHRALIHAVLSRADGQLGGTEIREAPTVAHAMAVLRSEPIDVVLLDIHLPDGLGLGLAAVLQDLPMAERPAILALTASVLPAEQEAALKAGCDAFLAKPYRPAALVSAITSLARVTGAGRFEA
jgi:CheY-like chemotaxis protein